MTLCRTLMSSRTFMTILNETVLVNLRAMLRRRSDAVLPQAGEQTGMA